MDTKILGYIFVVVGFLVLTSNIIFKALVANVSAANPILATLFGSMLYTAIVGFILVVVGIILIKPKKNVQAAEEVPIYQGDKIVGYRKEAK